MKTKRILVRLARLALVLLFSIAFQLPAQQADANTRPFNERKAKAGKGDGEAQLRLGVEYALGLGVTKDYREATNWLTKALSNGQPNALVFLSEAYAAPGSIRFDQQKALEFARRAVKEGGAYLVLAGFYEEVTSPLHDPKRAFEITRRFSEAGDAWATAELGVKYIEGVGVATNTTEGVRWLRQGITSMGIATKGLNSPAQSLAMNLTAARYANRLGNYYETGNFLPKDGTNALSWYRRAAELGDVESQVQLGYLLSKDGINPMEATKWFRAAAEEGNATAQHNLGSAYLNGIGVKKNPEEAVSWFRKAAEQGHPLSQYNLGAAYLQGFGLAQNRVEAVKWFRSAAGQGNGAAQHALGICYVTGEGVTKNDVQAYYWFNLAAVEGVLDAAARRDDLAKHMARAEIAEAQRLSREFKPGKATQSSSR